MVDIGGDERESGLAFEAGVETMECALRATAESASGAGDADDNGDTISRGYNGEGRSSEIQVSRTVRNTRESMARASIQSVERSNKTHLFAAFGQSLDGIVQDRRDRNVDGLALGEDMASISVLDVPLKDARLARRHGSHALCASHALTAG